MDSAGGFAFQNQGGPSVSSSDPPSQPPSGAPEQTPLAMPTYEIVGPFSSLTARNPNILLETPAMRTRRFVEATARRHGISVSELMGTGSEWVVVSARAEVAEELMRQGWSSVEIGEFFGRDHTTILHCVKAPCRGWKPIAGAPVKMDPAPAYRVVDGRSR